MFAKKSNKNEYSHILAYLNLPVISRFPFQISNGFFILIAVILLYVCSVNVKANNSMRFFIAKTFLPIMTVSSSPLSFLEYSIRYCSDFFHYKRNIEKTNFETSMLKENLMYLSKIEEENSNLKNLLNILNSSKVKYSGAEVMYRSQNNSFIMINKGKNDGILKDMIVMDESGLLGRITYAGESYSTIDLIVNISSRMPCQVKGIDVSGVLAGDGRFTTMIYPKGELQSVKEGMIVTTSNENGLLQEGFPIGVIQKILDEDRYRVKPFSNLEKTSYVAIVTSESNEYQNIQFQEPIENFTKNRQTILRDEPIDLKNSQASTKPDKAESSEPKKPLESGENQKNKKQDKQKTKNQKQQQSKKSKTKKTEQPIKEKALSQN
jgi:rod shape-determining protein MreC